MIGDEETMLTRNSPLTRSISSMIVRKSLLIGENSCPTAMQRRFLAMQMAFLGNHQPFLAIQC